MRKLSLFVSLMAFLTGCGSEPKNEPKPAPVAEKAAEPKPADESSRFPKQNLVDTRVVDNHLLGKSFMPGGTLANYKNGKTEYKMFVARLGSATDAALALPDWRKALTDAKLIPSFGGYFGKDEGVPVFVFAKQSWIAGVSGLPEKEADAKARLLAANLQ
jgi:hypothetical protein